MCTASHRDAWLVNITMNTCSAFQVRKHVIFNLWYRSHATMKYHVYQYILMSIQFSKWWHIMRRPNSPKSLNMDSGKITKLTKVLKQILIADRFWLRLQITARQVKRITGQYSLLQPSTLTWVLDRSLSHLHFASSECLLCTLPFITNIEMGNIRLCSYPIN